MPDVDVDWETVLSATGRMRTEAGLIKDDLTRLLHAVQGVLTPEGGLWLSKASPIMAETFTNFEAMLTKAIDNIPAFAASFDQTAIYMRELDHKLAEPPAAGK